MNTDGLIAEARRLENDYGDNYEVMTHMSVLADALEARQPSEDDRGLIEALRKAHDAAGSIPQGTMDHETQWLPFANLYNAAERVIDSRAAVPDAATERARQAEAELRDMLRVDIPSLKAERDAALAAIERVRVAKYEVDSVHHIHGADCLCGYSSARSRSRTEHITEAMLAALDGAPEPEWEYGLLVEALGDTEPEPYPTRESAQYVIDHPEMYRKWTHDNPVTMYSRRHAGPWLPVEEESKP